MAREVIVRPSGPSWGAVLDAWLAAVGGGGALSILIAIFAAWLGGLLAPARIAAVVPAAIPATVPVAGEPVARPAPVERHRGRYRLLPSAGRKGGERADEVEAKETEHS